MSILTLGRKSRLLNALKATDVIITGAAQDAIMFIAGYGQFPVKEVVGPVRASRAISAVINKHVLVAANITLANLPAAGTTKQVYVEFLLNSSRYQGEFEGANAEGYGGKKVYPITVASNETAETFLKKLYAQMTTEALESGFDWIKASAVYATPGDANTAITLTIETRDASLEISKVLFKDSENGTSAIVTVYNPTKTSGFEGVGTYENVDQEFPQTEASNIPYMQNTQFAGQQRPIPGARYSRIGWQMEHSRPELSSPEAADATSSSRHAFELFILESAENNTQRDRILAHLASKTGVEVVYYTSALTVAGLQQTGNLAAFQAN